MDIKLTWGDGTDADTWQLVLGALEQGAWVVGVTSTNGVDFTMVVEELVRDGRPGLGGRMFPNGSMSIWLDADEIEEVKVH
jgi:hypothetical protein